VVMTLRAQRIAECQHARAIADRTTDDGERMYQYFDRKLQEELAVKPPVAVYSQDSVKEIDDDGTIWFKPPRSMHRSRIIRLLDRITRSIDPNA